MGDYPRLIEKMTMGDEVLELRGLSLPHILAIVTALAEPMNNLYKLGTSGKLEANAASVAMNLGDDFAIFAGLVIGHGTRDTDRAEWFGNEMPMGFQIEALDKIANLTVANAGGLEKLMEIVSKAAGSLSRLQG